MTALDLAALGVLVIVGVAVLTLLVALAIIPGKIAFSRHHVQSDAIRVAGYLGILFPPLWMFAFIWAYTRTHSLELEDFNQRIAILEQRIGADAPPHSQRT